MWPRDDGGGAGECNRAQVGSENQRYHWRLLTFSKLEWLYVTTPELDASTKKGITYVHAFHASQLASDGV
jgi:hypothetical protein